MDGVELLRCGPKPCRMVRRRDSMQSAPVLGGVCWVRVVGCGARRRNGGRCWLRGRLLLSQVVDELVDVMMLLKFARGSSGGGSR